MHRAGTGSLVLTKYPWAPTVCWPLFQVVEHRSTVLLSRELPSVLKAGTHSP